MGKKEADEMIYKREDGSFVCGECGPHKRFNQKCRARSHAIAEHLNIKYKCPDADCSYTCTRPDNMCSHTARQHGYRLIRAPDSMEDEYKKEELLTKKTKPKSRPFQGSKRKITPI